MGSRKLTAALCAIVIWSAAPTMLTASSRAQSTVIPSEFRGEWTNQQRYCGIEGDSIDSVLYVSATMVGYYENQWRVKWVRRTAQGLHIAYFPRTDFTMYAPVRLRLSPAGKRIFTSDDKADAGYLRCAN
jgi:hypothetical protein